MLHRQLLVLVPITYRGDDYHSWSTLRPNWQPFMPPSCISVLPLLVYNSATSSYQALPPNGAPLLAYHRHPLIIISLIQSWWGSCYYCYRHGFGVLCQLLAKLSANASSAGKHSSMLNFKNPTSKLLASSYHGPTPLRPSIRPNPMSSRFSPAT